MTKKTIAVALSLSLGLSGVAPAIPSNAAELPGDTGVVNEVSVATDTDADYQEQEAVQADNAVQAESLVVLNETNFPDEAFRKSLKETYDTDGDGYIDANAITSVKATRSGVASVKGIELFPNLQYLMLGGNKISSIDVSKNTELLQISMFDNALTSIDLSHNTKLKMFDFDNNNLTSLDIDNNADLTIITCRGNKLTSLNLTNQGELTFLDCRDNKISELDLSKCEKLQGLYCGNNELHTLNLRNNTALKTLSCAYNYFEGVDFSYLDTGKIRTCETTPFKEQVLLNETNFPDDNFRACLSDTFDLDKDGVILNSDVKELDVSCKKIGSLKGIELFPAITVLQCGGNRLRELDLRNNKALMRLWCYENDLEHLDLRNNTALMYFDCRDNYLADEDFSYLNISEDNLRLTPQKVKVALTEENFPDEAFRNYLAEEFDPDGTGSIVRDNVKYLHANDMGIKSLKGIELLTNVYVIECNGNELTELDVSKNEKLATLDCDTNKLTSLDVSKTRTLRTSAYVRTILRT